ncbi:MAG: thiol peroxidase [Gammaproteobacteria bacterium]|nr:thiol peroxidase [Gammaproteobacteria bacterium]
MATITLKGNPIHTCGELPKVGQACPLFTLTGTDLSELALSSLKGHKVILNIFPSLDTPTCAISVRKFNEQAASLPNVKVLCISADLPFAQKRFCGAEGISNVITASSFRHPEFGTTLGVKIIDGPIAGLMSRAVVVLDEQGKVLYTEQVAEIADEPDYEKALAAL